MAETETTGEDSQVAGFFAELMRRRVLHIGGAYIAGAWLGAEILNFLFDQFLAPDWAYRLLAIVFVIGFPISMVLAWIIQVQEDGSWAIDSSRGEHRTVLIAIVLGGLITAGLSWLIIPRHELDAVYTPLSDTSLAVLNVTPATVSPDDQTAADTLYRSLIAGLERSPELVLIRLRPEDQADGLQNFGESIGVAGLATFRINTLDDVGLVEVSYLDVVRQEETWNQSYAGGPMRITQTAEEIANGLLEAMALPSLENGHFTGTVSQAAYEACLHGQKLAEEQTEMTLERAADAFRNSIEADRGYTRAYVGLAQALYDLIELSGITGDTRAKLEEEASKAVEIAQRLEPRSADALSLLGLGQANRHLRIVAFERALELDPDHYMSYYRYSRQMQADSDLEQAESLMRRAIALRPTSARFRTALADILSQQGRDSEAEIELDKAAAFLRSKQG